MRGKVYADERQKRNFYSRADKEMIILFWNSSILAK